MKREVLLLIALILASLFPVLPAILGDTLETIVIIANVPPYILSGEMNVFVEGQDVGTITLSENTTVFVKCNATLHDPNGWQDISSLNGTIYDDNVAGSSSGAPDNNYRYINSSCSLFDGQGATRGGECGFTVWYYAHNSTKWKCNLTVYDAGVEGSNPNESNSTITTFTINPLVALNIPSTMDFGTLNPGEISLVNKTNVTNTGNTLIDLTIYGYANNATDSPNAMNCTLGKDKNISLYYLRYNVTDNIGGGCTTFGWTSNYWNLTNITNAKNWTSFNLAPRENDAAGGESRNITCFILRVPSTDDGLSNADVGGVCKGIISFAAFLNE